MKRKKFLSAALVVGACIAVTPVWGQDSQTDRIQNDSKPGTASKPGTGSVGGSTKDPMGNMSKGSDTVGGESPTDRIQNTSKPGTASRPDSTTDRMGNMNKGMRGSHDDVKSAQEALRDNGFDPGPIDGIMGSRTRAALRSFQQSKNMKATGQLDADTSQQLGVDQSSSSR